jgi:hypothetical protein
MDNKNRIKKVEDGHAHRLETTESDVNKLEAGLELTKVDIAKQEVRIGNVECGLNEVKEHLYKQDDEAQERFDKQQEQYSTLDAKIDATNLSLVKSTEIKSNIVQRNINVIITAAVVALVSSLIYVLASFHI